MTATTILSANMQTTKVDKHQAARHKKFSCLYTVSQKELQQQHYSFIALQNVSRF